MGRSDDFDAGVNHVKQGLAVGQTVRGSATDKVTVHNVGDHHEDHELADVAGYTSRHFGYNVTRHPDSGAATISLWKD